MKSSVLKLSRTAALAVVLTFTAVEPLSANEAAHWNRIAVDTTTEAMPLDPVTESRILAIVHLAMHDAANAVQPHFQTYGASSREYRGGSVDAAIAAAAYATLHELLPDHRASLTREFESRIGVREKSDLHTRGIAAGKAAAREMLHMRKNDGADKSSSLAPGTKPGQYRPTPPDFTPAFLSHWGSVRPFALTSSEQFRPISPPAPGGSTAISDIEVVRLIGSIDSAARTHEQSEIACYWYEASTRGWNRIARDIGIGRGLNIWEQTRMLALVNVAMADGFIGGFEAKYHYNYWRPATAIREGGQAGWLNYLPTPPVPDYPSTHTVLGAAAATAMERCLGTDFVSFSMTSGAPYPNITRRFWSLSAAARENGASRVLAGIHFPTAVEAGYLQGAQIGHWAATHVLRPLGAEPLVTVAAAK